MTQDRKAQEKVDAGARKAPAITARAFDQSWSPAGALRCLQRVLRGGWTGDDAVWP